MVHEAHPRILLRGLALCLLGSKSSPPSVADEDVPLKETVAVSEVCRRNGRFGRGSLELAAVYAGAVTGGFECTAALTALSRGNRIFNVGVADWEDWVIVTEALGVIGVLTLGGLEAGNTEALLKSEASGPTDRIMELDAGAEAWTLATNAPSSFVVSDGLAFRRWRVVLVDFP